MFTTYLQLGVEHILDLNGYDHILFILTITVLCLIIPIRSLIILVTAFTIGHSITLALSALEILILPSKWIELFIPITIILACLDNIYFLKSEKSIYTRYVITLFFGFIHGMGFSNFFKSILGKEESIILPLLSFNIGVEIAQLIILGIGSIILLLFSKLIKENKKIILTLSVIILMLSSWLLIEQLKNFF